MMVQKVGDMDYGLEVLSSNASRFFLCYVISMKAKRFSLVSLEGKGILRGCNIN